MDAPRASLLVVDDEPTIRELLATSLRFAGFEVDLAGTGAQALERIERKRPDLVVLDVMLPDMDGFAVVRRLRRRRERDRLPVLFLTARNGVGDKVGGLSAGGDDYLTKPFSVAELIARIEAVLRRTGGYPDDGRLVVADLELDPVAHRVWREGRTVALSPTEFRLLAHLMANAGRVQPKARIAEEVWNHDFGGDFSIVESYVSYLRRKVDPGPRKLIHTVRGVGYVLRHPQG
ncbi:response regulator transcription factor [Streptomyces orinoci]|uniref:Response regulator transcription factor n=1 Tax=Streptomyces orinoci TaxID=67339 RepID=A0ABV3JYE9_STRON|nr:response regulator transcription factor [Streptomyces orinoci]